MANKASTLRQFQARFPTEDSCLEHLKQTRFGERHDCEKCDREAKFYRVKGRRSYACEHCGAQIYPTAGTPFDRTRTPLRDWFFVMFQFCTSRNGVAAKEVERQLGVTYKTAWRMCHMIREYMGAVDGDDFLGGAGTVVEIDETIMGGSISGKGSGYMGNKAVVVGIKERGGKLAMRVVDSRTRGPMEAHIHASIRPGTTISSDEFGSYRFLSQQGYRHITVSHKQGQRVGKFGATTNGIEGVWAALKRGINGTHVHVSAKHLPKYLAEFEYRHNMRHLPHLMLDRLMVSFSR
ncbi:IS1595 family transposase [Sphingomonas bacterium]|uniref:IS1595 family transposase n=1 Tax=Sphingomonas bacterium TaxID=1895847 RepID=UPI0015755BC0|nr:IS1595 family transposase [Sphingomonas bacterium]